MSRIIVKNLPNNLDTNKLREKFSELGFVTDLQLKYTPQGKFRKFCFVGYETTEQASAAIHHFDKTFFGTSRLQVELCSEFGDSNKPKSWSKYSVDSTAYKNKSNNDKGKKSADLKVKDKKKRKEKKKNVNEEVAEKLRQHKDDPDFIEFMEVHGKSDTIRQLEIEDEAKDGEEEDSDDNEPNKSNKALSGISDLEYLKSKMKGEKIEVTAGRIVIQQKCNKPTKQYYTVKISNLPYKVTKKDIRRILNPLSPASLRLPPKIKGIAFVGFETEKEKRRALIKNKTFLNGRQLAITEYQQKEESNDTLKSRWIDQENSLKNEESIAESGRIFIRNLSYTVKEEEIEKLFSKYGPITEVILPIDRISRMSKGYGIVTFVMPEHAVVAYTSLDGTVLHGRMLHLLPAKAKENEEDSSKEDGSNYKKAKMKGIKAKSGSAHNWNTLFLDLNAVAEIVAQKYNVSKEEVLTGKDAAVRVALGETQLVAETKNFLEKNGVLLDAFNQEVMKRSKTIILVKNLPANTTVKEIRELFAKHGELGRVILPPNGITGLVEFLEPSEARIAFRSLAYSKFKYAPLYLEWAPDNSFSIETKEINEYENAESKKERNKDEEDNSDDALIPENNATLFVKNLDFNTTEDDLRKHFRSCGKIASTIIARRKDTKIPGALLSMGYGFVHFYLESSLNEALKTLQGSDLNGHFIELKRSNRTLPIEILNRRKKTNMAHQTGTKIMIRNIPFQATKKEITDLFKIFGELKFVRLPKKLVGTGSHRGFAFVEFVTKNDAKRAMQTLCQSTHLLGRRLVLEWAETDEDVSVLRKRTAKHFHVDSKGKKKKPLDIKEENVDDEDYDELTENEF